MSTGKNESVEELHSHHNKKIQWDDLDPKKYYFYNFLLGGSIDLLMYPLDVIRTRLQVQGSHNITQSFPQYNGTMDGFRKLVGLEGKKALYKGFLTSELGYLTSRGIYFGSYEISKQTIRKFFNKDLESDSDLFFVTTVSGAISEALASFVWVPFDVATQTVQIQGSLQEPKYKPGLGVFQKIYQEKGMRGLYKGFGATMIRNVPYSGIWWGTYEMSKLKLTEFNIREKLHMKERTGKVLSVHETHHNNNINNNNNNNKDYEVENEDPIIHFFSGFFAAVFATTITNPLDVAKTRLQTGSFGPNERPNFYTIIKSTIKKEGVRALWKGLVPSLLTSAPYSMISIFLYEEVKKLSLK
ncbi:hypothetical protein DICPUDRAFT_76676 [Dictyostelium purpureum]|uniref:Mitochondrial substrate carrier family protein n=1 Tax=Dictyostelium purpureum TaxID=5786 RepID=F0ZEB0_DICPU|nr:uncharacterized protein DICPUDRAFT_76676 [Dictyostelium purpureum]EGC37724.1 hypothetical protein DICPUDRAFT_76676 [Dictyostelium purpureum]|eukprot:XP_003285745.1 hypothetical protein DICPUDRAFT_76676 [Dictyostelium purpureum]